MSDSPIFDTLLGEQHPCRRSVIIHAEAAVATDAGRIKLGALSSAAHGWIDDQRYGSTRGIDTHVEALRTAQQRNAESVQILSRAFA